MIALRVQVRDLVQIIEHVLHAQRQRDAMPHRDTLFNIEREMRRALTGAADILCLIEATARDTASRILA